MPLFCIEDFLENPFSIKEISHISDMLNKHYMGRIFSRIVLP